MTDDQPVYDDRTLRRDIQRLTLDWVRLRDTMPSPARRAAGVRGGSRKEFGHPAEWASDKAAQIVAVLSGWHGALADHRNETLPREGWAEQVKIQHAWRYLDPRCDQLLAYAGEDALAEIRTLHGQIRAALGLGRARYILPVPCPAEGCGMKALERLVGAGQDFIVCGVCGYAIRDEYYPFLVRMALDTALDAGDSEAGS